MKEVEKKDVPEVSGGMTIPDAGWLPIVAPNPLGDYPPGPGSLTDCPSPLEEELRKNQVQL